VLVEKCSHGELYSKIRIYITILEEAFSGKKMWWWSEVWDLNAPLKMKIIFWLSLKKKILTWDNGLHRGWIGPNRCSLCCAEEEIVSHPFFMCPYAKEVWSYVLVYFNVMLAPTSSCLERYFFAWKEEKAVRESREVP
jgi:hypothetical protein